MQVLIECIYSPPPWYHTNKGKGPPNMGVSHLTRIMPPSAPPSGLTRTSCSCTLCVEAEARRDVSNPSNPPRHRLNSLAGARSSHSAWCSRLTTSNCSRRPSTSSVPGADGPNLASRGASSGSGRARCAFKDIASSKGSSQEHSRTEIGEGESKTITTMWNQGEQNLSQLLFKKLGANQGLSSPTS